MSTLSPQSARRHYRHPSRVALYAAPRLGLQPGAVEQLIHGHDACHIRTAVLYEAALFLGDHALAARIVAPIEGARARFAERSQETPADLIQSDTESDGREDGPRMAYVRCPSPVTRSALLRHLCTRAGTIHRLIAALEREQRDGRS